MKKSAILFVVLIASALVIGIPGCDSGSSSTPPLDAAKQSTRDADVKSVQVAVDAYLLTSGHMPTAEGRLPASDEYALIDFDALYPDFIIELPRHHDEGVWRIDSAGRVSVNIISSDY